VTILAAGALIGNRHRRARREGESAGPSEHGLPQALHAGYAEKRQLILRMLSGHTCRKPGECITVRQLMTKNLKTIAANTAVGELRQWMHDIRIRHLLVVRGEDQLVGIVSDRDVTQREGRTAADIMTRNPVTVGPDTPAIQAISAMLSGRFSCLPVAEEGKLVGLMTTSDLMMALQCTLQLMTQSAGAGYGDAPSEVKGARYFARLLEPSGEEALETVGAGR
jgi:CBS domain-containing protein